MWRRALQICSLKKSAVIISVLFTCVLLFADAPYKMPEMPQLSMPELTIKDLNMPSISAPRMGTSVYQPSVPGIKNANQNSSTVEKNNVAPVSSALSEDNNSEVFLSNLIKNNTSLTASDISSLYDSGLFSNISSISSLTNTVTSSASTNALLQQVLTSLEELKNEQKKSSLKQQENLAKLKLDSETFKTREPSILRFKINGYNVTDSLTTVFFSESDPDGSFLLSADRKYYLNQKARTETLYILFKSQKNSGSNITYVIQPRIVQDVKNENSYVYKLCQSNSLVAEKTGNLVVVHSTDPSLTVDLLLDLDK